MLRGRRVPGQSGVQQQYMPGKSAAGGQRQCGAAGQAIRGSRLHSQLGRQREDCAAEASAREQHCRGCEKRDSRGEQQRCGAFRRAYGCQNRDSCCEQQHSSCLASAQVFHRADRLHVRIHSGTVRTFDLLRYLFAVLPSGMRIRSHHWKLHVHAAGRGHAIRPLVGRLRRAICAALRRGEPVVLRRECVQLGIRLPVRNVQDASRPACEQQHCLRRGRAGVLHNRGSLRG